MAYFDKTTKEIGINRGDRGTIRLKTKSGNFTIGDKFKFSIVEKGKYPNVVFQKTYVVAEESPEFYITLTSQDTRIGEVISKEKIYWYEIEYNGDKTVVGYDKSKAKKFVLFPEAPDKEGSGE